MNTTLVSSTVLSDCEEPRLRMAVVQDAVAKSIEPLLPNAVLTEAADRLDSIRKAGDQHAQITVRFTIDIQPLPVPKSGEQQ